MKWVFAAFAALTLIAAAVLAWRFGSAFMRDSDQQQLTVRAEAYVAQGSWFEAWEALHDSMKALRQEGPDHPDYLKTLLLLADAQEALGYYEEAYPLYIEALRLYRERLGPNSPEAAAMFYEMGRVKQRLGEYENALGIFRETLQFWEQSVGLDDPQIVPTLIGIAQVHSELKAYAESRQMYEWAIGVQRRQLGNDDPSLAPLERALAAVLVEMGESELATRFSDHADEISGKMEPSENESMSGQE